MPAFRNFVSGEKQRLAQKKQAVFRAEREKWGGDFIKFSQTFMVSSAAFGFLLTLVRKLTSQGDSHALAASLSLSPSVLHSGRAFRNCYPRLRSPRRN